MTEKKARELEKKAIDVIRNHSHKLIDNFTQEDLENREISIFMAGYHEGNKANEWHYIKNGDLPNDNEYVLIYTDLNNCYVAKRGINHFMSKGWGFIPMSTVIAWKEIVLPELKENE